MKSQVSLEAVTCGVYGLSEILVFVNKITEIVFVFITCSRCRLMVPSAAPRDMTSVCEQVDGCEGKEKDVAV